MGSTLYSAGLGVTDLPKAVKEIEGLQGSIYRPGGKLGSTQAVAPVLSELEVVETELSLHHQDAPRYAELIDRIEKIKVEITDLEEGRAEINGKLDHQRKLLTVRDDLMEIGILQDKLSGLPYSLQFPVDGVARLENLLAQVVNLEEVELQAAQIVKKLQEVVASPLAEGDLMEDSTEIRKAISERARLSAAVRDLPERQSEANQQGADVARRLKELGHGWDPARLERFDVSLPSKDKVNQEKEQAAQIRQALTNRRTEMESAEKEFYSSSEATKNAALELEEAGPSDYDEATLTKRRGAINSARIGMGRLSESNQRRAELNTAGSGDSNVSGRTLMMAAIITSLIAGIALLYWGLIGSGGVPAVGVAALSLAIALGLAVLDFRRRIADGALVLTDSRDTDIAGVENELSDARNILGIDSLDFTKLEILGQQLEASAQKWTMSQNLERIHRNAKIELERRSKDLERATAAVAKLDAQRVQAEKDWTVWLKERDLVETMSADGVLDLFSRVESARVTLSNKLERQGRVSAIEHDMVEISELVEPLAASHGISIDVEHPTTLIPAIDELSRRLESGFLELSTLEANRASLTEAEERLEQARRRLQVVRGDLSELMLLVDTDDVEEFRRLGSVDHGFQTCRNDLDGHVTAIRLLFGPEADQEAFRAEIEERSSLALEESINETQQYLDEVEQNRDSLREELTLAERELAELGASDEASDLMARRETLVEELRDLGSQWSKYSLALVMLQKARDRHEKERQPQVIQSASEFFQNVTQRRYQGLRAPTGESVINAVTAAGEERTSSQLSRGTREQMYLGLRFGLVREFSQHMTSLPVIVDDALVNSDPRRARAASEGLANLIGTNQVLVFTCHPALVEQLQEACSNTEVHNLESLP